MPVWQQVLFDVDRPHERLRMRAQQGRKSALTYAIPPNLRLAIAWMSMKQRHCWMRNILDLHPIKPETTSPVCSAVLEERWRYPTITPDSIGG
jgi:hypothetical protein